MFRRLFATTISLLGILVSSATVAQSEDAEADAAAVAAVSGVPTGRGVARAGWRSQYGAGVIANPKFVGSEDYNITPIPYLDFRYFDEKGSKYFANVPQGIGGFFYRSREADSGDFINIGAAIAPGFNVRDDSFEGLDEIGISAEARLYLEAGGPRWVAAAVLAQDVGSGHEGAYLDLSLNRRGRLGPPSGFFAVGPVLRVGDDTYKAAFFSVDEQESMESGLPEYSADAGVERLGFQGLVSLPMGRSKWRFTAVARVSTLIDDAADSPIVEDERQWFFLSALSRSF